MQRRGGKAPSGHLSRLKPVELDPLDEYGLPSKGEKRLLSPKVQEAYYAKIVERYLAFCTEAGDQDGLQEQFARLAIGDDTKHSPSPSKPAPASPTTTLPQILSALRKLREAIVATSRADTFAVQVYLFAIRLGILAGAYETYYPSLLYLLRFFNRTSAHAPRPCSSSSLSPSPSPSTTTAPSFPSFQSPFTSTAASSPSPPASSTHPADKNNNSNPSASKPLLTTLELHEATAYLILDTACRRNDLCEAYALFHAHKRGQTTSLPPATPTTVRFLAQTLRALAADNWVLFRRLQASAPGPCAALMALAEPRLRRHTLKAFGRAYLAVPLRVLEEQTGARWAELTGRDGVGWELEDVEGEGEGEGKGEGKGGGEKRVVIRRVKGRAV